MKKSQPDAHALSRRTVFAGAGTVGALAAAAAVLPGTQPTDAQAPAKAAIPDDQRHGRYQVTAHVQHYYRTAKV